MFCKKCGNEINDTSKFCTICGTKINTDVINKDTIVLPEADDIINDYPKQEDAANDIVNELTKEKETSLKKKSVRKKAAIIAAIVLILSLMGVGSFKLFYKQNAVSTSSSVSKASIEIKEIKLDDYPTVNISLTISNYSEELDVNNISLKEDDSYKKSLNLTKDSEDGQYIITYSTDSGTQDKERKVSIFYYISGKEVSADSKYTIPDISSDKDTNSHNDTSSAHKIVNTTDNSEVMIKDLFSYYKSSSIDTINYRDISYVQKYVDLSGNLIKEFTNTINNYAKQDITESLLEWNIEKISKLDDTHYEVITYEKYYIRYGTEQVSKYMDFRTSYTITKNGNVYKVYSINKITRLSSKDI